MFGKVCSRLSARTGSVGLAASLIAAASITSRLIGVVRDRLLSGTFGAGMELDAYYAAFRFPDFMFNLIILGAIGAGFVPVMSGYLTKDNGKEGSDAPSWDFVRLLTTMFGVTLVVISAVCFVFAPHIVPLITPGFGEAGRELTTSLARIMFIGGPVLGISSILGSVLQSHRRFLAYALAPILYNLGIISGVWLLGPAYGIKGAAIGVLVGIVFHFVVQYAAVRGAGFRFGWRWRTRDSGLGEVIRLAIPRTASLGLTQINLMFVTGIATTLSVGAVAVFNLAYNLEMAPVGVIGISFAVASFPVVSELAVRGKLDALVTEFNKSVRAILYLAIPSTVLLLLLRAQAVRVVFGTGAFDWGDTVSTADTLAFFTLSLFAQALIPLVARTFFALRDVKTPLLAVLAGIVVERLAAAYLVSVGWEAPGLALGWSIGATVNLAVMWLALRRRLGGLGELRLMRDLFFMSVTAAACAFSAQSVKVVVGGVVNMQTFLGVFTQGAAAGMVGAAVYVGLTYFLGLGEARGYLAVARRKAKRLNGRLPFRRKRATCVMGLEDMQGQTQGSCDGGRAERR